MGVFCVFCVFVHTYAMKSVCFVFLSISVSATPGGLFEKRLKYYKDISKGIFKVVRRLEKRVCYMIASFHGYLSHC